MIEMEAEAEAECSQEGPTLSNDIWKKFQLIPTPPRSPSHEADLTSFTDYDLPNFDLPSLDLAVDLENILPDHLQNCGGPGGLPCARGTCTSCTQLALAGSELRHDCMWRGTCTAEAHAHHPRYPQQHTDSTSQIPELLLDSAAMECETDFAHLDDLQEDDDEDDDEAHMDDLDEVEDDLAARPDTPSESSETDTDQEHDEAETETEDEGEHVATAVHVDHSYHCLRAPSPHHAHAHALPHTPSESEDEIDVVSVGSPDSAYSSSSSRNGRPRLAGEKRKRGASRSRSGDPTTQALVTPPNLAVPSTTPVLPTSCAAATTTFFTPTSAGNRKILKVRSGSPQVPSSSTSSSTTKSSRHTKRAHHLEKRASTTNVSSTTTSSSLSTIIPDPLANSSTTTTTTSTVGASRKPTHTTKNTPSPTHTNTPYTTTTTTTSTKILKRIPKSVHHHGRKKRGNRGESDDPERRHLHNSLERMRRVDLRNAFEELRSLVPDLCDREKAPKVEILRRASEHCYGLTQRGRLLEQEMEKQKRLQGELKRRLAALHKQQARV